MSLQKPVDALEQMLRSFNIDIEHTNVQVYLYEKLISLFTITNLSLLLNRFFSMLGDFLVAVFSIGFLTFFFLRDEELIIRSILSLVPLDYYEKAKKVWLDSERMLKRYFIGLLTETLLVTIFIAVGLWIVGIKYALLIGLFSGLMNVIPYVGPIIGITFALFVGLTTNSDMSMLSVITKILIVFPLINIADNFLLQPFIYSNSVKAHPLEIFLVSLAGSAIGGIGGMILAVPTYTVLRVFIKEFIFGLILRKNKAK
jgi:predicted PurR-regulated permease PerM